jgi:Aldehyde dehydrogenase family/Bacterial extracellular solute-binding proteins, family 5 Middle
VLFPHPASIQDRDGAGLILQASRRPFPFIRKVFADAGYRGPRVAAFAPWNFPINQIVRKLSAALAAGCSIIVKAPEETPAAPAELLRAFVDAGVTAGVVNLVSGAPAEISEYLISHPVIRKIFFTGSTPVGKQLAALAGKHMKPPWSSAAKRVRDALQLAVDNSAVQQLGYDNAGTLAENHHVCPTHPEYVEMPKVERDMAKAQALLSEAGQTGFEHDLISVDIAWL